MSDSTENRFSKIRVSIRSRVKARSKAFSLLLGMTLLSIFVLHSLRESAALLSDSLRPYRARVSRFAGLPYPSCVLCGSSASNRHERNRKRTDLSSEHPTCSSTQPALVPRRARYQED